MSPWSLFTAYAEGNRETKIPVPPHLLTFYCVCRREPQAEKKAREQAIVFLLRMQKGTALTGPKRLTKITFLLRMQKGTP